MPTAPVFTRNLPLNILKICIKRESGFNIGISRAYLNSAFQKELGISAQTFLIDYKMHKAASLLVSTSLSVKEIANNVGYEDQLVFSKAFKKKFGMSPKNYKTHKEMMDKFDEKQVDDPV